MRLLKTRLLHFDLASSPLGIRDNGTSRSINDPHLFLSSIFSDCIPLAPLRAETIIREPRESRREVKVGRQLRRDCDGAKIIARDGDEGVVHEAQHQEENESACVAIVERVGVLEGGLLIYKSVCGLCISACAI